jgi:cell volume regulation protein A
MTNTAILAVSALLVFAYLLDIFGRRTKLPSVVLLIATGMIGRLVLDALGIHLRFVERLVPLFGTIGLILIVLEGAVDLEVRRERAGLIARSAATALLGFGITLAAFSWGIHTFLGLTWPYATLAAMPFAVISSAVAIPSSHGLPKEAREFVTYESSLSDIIGVLAFYSWLAADGSLEDFAIDLFGGGFVSLLAAVVAALGLFYLINRIEGHVRFLPLLAGLVLLYAIGKASHLSPLIMVLVCGLLLNNPHLLEWNERLRKMHGEGYDATLKEFKSIVIELTFATKSFFFLMLGYWTDLSYMADWRAWALAFAMIVTIYLSRAAILALLRQPDWRTLTWLAPRGLITVLLFLTAMETGELGAFPFGTVMLVVLVTATATAIAHRRPNEPGQPAADEAPRAEDAKPAEAVIAELPKNS